MSASISPRTAVLKADLLLLVTAAIWGAAFVAQRVGMEHIGPMAFNGIRFALGAACLLPLAMRSDGVGAPTGMSGKFALLAASGAGLALFASVSLQQIGIISTTAGKAGFITGLYVLVVPLLGLFFRQRPTSGVWIGAVLAAVGMYFLSVTEDFGIGLGDLLVLGCAVCCGAHVLAVGWLSPRMPAARLSVIQYLVCSVLSLALAAVTEEPTLDGVTGAAIPILYGGLMSVGVAYTLQVVAQKDAPPAHSAVLLSLEGVFAAIAGWLLLGERLGPRGLLGCGLMLVGMLVAQLWPEKRD